MKVPDARRDIKRRQIGGTQEGTSSVFTFSSRGAKAFASASNRTTKTMPRTCGATTILRFQQQYYYSTALQLLHGQIATSDLSLPSLKLFMWYSVNSSGGIYGQLSNDEKTPKQHVLGRPFSVRFSITFSRSNVS